MRGYTYQKERECEVNVNLIIATVSFLLLLGDCASVKPPPSEKMQVKLTDEWVELLKEDTAFAFQKNDTTNLTLPPILTQKVSVDPPAGRSPRPFDSVFVNAVITKKGNVKRAWILKSESPYFNKAALKAVVQWKFQPALRNGTPIDTLIKIAVPLN
jgi:TonB family protein